MNYFLSSNCLSLSLSLSLFASSFAFCKWHLHQQFWPLGLLYILFQVNRVCDASFGKRIAIARAEGEEEEGENGDGNGDEDAG